MINISNLVSDVIKSVMEFRKFTIRTVTIILLQLAVISLDDNLKLLMMMTMEMIMEHAVIICKNLMKIITLTKMMTITKRQMMKKLVKNHLMIMTKM